MYSRADRKRNRVKVRRRIRGKISGTATTPRLAVFRSLRHMYVQAIDDDEGVTLAAASTREKECLGRLGDSGSGGVTAAKLVGELIATRLKERGVEAAVFDRGGFVYHGRIKALADSAREGGLRF